MGAVAVAWGWQFERKTWEDAKYANGAGVARWFEQNVNVKKDDDTALRRLYEWRVGGTASFPCIDRLMVRYDRHVSELPDEVWLAERPDREAHEKRVMAALPPQKMCEGCGKPISYRKPNGDMRGPKGYAEAKFCSRDCSFQVLSGNQPLAPLGPKTMAALGAKTKAA